MNARFIYRFTRQEVHRQHFRDALFLFCFAGFKGGTLEVPEQKYSRDLPAPAHICLALPGMIYDFAYSSKRESWAVYPTGMTFRIAAEPGFAQVREGNGWVTVPMLLPLEPERIPAWRLELSRMRECLQSPLPGNRLRVKLGMAGILRHLMDARTGAHLTESPAHELRRLIDEDEADARNLAEFAAEIGYSRDHLRDLFAEEFGLAPSAYRQQRRLARVMEFIAGTRLSLKEIAVRAGFRQQSHLTAVFRKAFGLTPSEAIKRYRQGGE